MLRVPHASQPTRLHSDCASTRPSRPSLLSSPNLSPSILCVILAGLGFCGSGVMYLMRSILSFSCHLLVLVLLLFLVPLPGLPRPLPIFEACLCPWQACLCFGCLFQASRWIGVGCAQLSSRSLSPCVHTFHTTNNDLGTSDLDPSSWTFSICFTKLVPFCCANSVDEHMITKCTLSPGL